MIFGDTKVQVVSFLKAGHRTAFLLSLSREGVKQVDWFERGSEYRIAEEHSKSRARASRRIYLSALAEAALIVYFVDTRAKAGWRKTRILNRAL